ncbi:MAG TPA: sortase [Arthrobacter sp.]|nr:sortase [Arthrobacter sp.]
MQSSATRIAAAAVTMALLIAGCTAPQEAAAPPPVATENTATGKTAPGTRASASGGPGTQPLPPATTAPVPGPAIPVRPATPQAQTPKDPAPRSLTVEGTTINMPIVEVGVSPDGAMEIPEPFNEAGWYRFGPPPGAAAGTAVIAAHVDTTSDSAPFSQLKSLAPGTLVTVQREGAPPLTFRVTRVELMAKDAFDGASVFRRGGPPELKLVTCGGRWLDERQDYGDNVIVTAVPA